MSSSIASDNFFKESPWAFAEDLNDEKLEKEIWRRETLSDPRLIYEFLCSKVYGQQEACKAIAFQLYATVNNIQTTRFLLCGPPGCGKTYIYQILREYLWDNIIICNSANMSCDAWKGSNKITSPFRRVDPSRPAIVVYDEFDKIVVPRFSNSENVSASLQSEFLALIQPSSKYLAFRNADGEPYDVDLTQISYAFVGSFASAAENIADKKKVSALGFATSVKENPKSFDTKLTLDDVKDFGMITELCSRITRMICLNKLDFNDFKHILTDFAGPINELEDLYELDKGFIRKKVLAESDIEEIAHYAYEKGLGVRATTAQITCKLQDYIFEHFDEYSKIIEKKGNIQYGRSQ